MIVFQLADLVVLSLAILETSVYAQFVAISLMFSGSSLSQNVGLG